MKREECCYSYMYIVEHLAHLLWHTKCSTWLHKDLKQEYEKIQSGVPQMDALYFPLLTDTLVAFLWTTYSKIYRDCDFTIHAGVINWTTWIKEDSLLNSINDLPAIDLWITLAFTSMLDHFSSSTAAWVQREIWLWKWVCVNEKYELLNLCN